MGNFIPEISGYLDPDVVGYDSDGSVKPADVRLVSDPANAEERVYRVAVSPEAPVILEGVRFNASYEVTEPEEWMPEGWSAVSGEDYASGVLTEDEAVVSVALTNEFAPQGSLSLGVEKYFDGEQTDLPAFDFELKDEAGEVVATAQNSDDGSVVFAPVMFGLDDVGSTKTYTITEAEGTNPGIIYDPKTITVHVGVSVEGGRFVYDVSVDEIDLDPHSDDNTLATYDSLPASGTYTYQVGYFNNQITIALPKTGHGGIIGGVAIGAALLALGSYGLVSRKREDED